MPGSWAEITASPRATVTTVLAVAISLFHIYANTIGNISVLVQNGLHFAGFALLCVLVNPLSRAAGASGKTLRLIDLGAGLLIALAAICVVFAESAIYARGVRLTPLDWVAGLVCIVGAIELTRRTTGWIIPALIVLALSYLAWWGQYVPGVFRFSGLSSETILFRSLYNDDALFGTIATISSTFVFMFILFGAFLLRSGAGEFIIDISRVIAGRFTGGPGFVAVFASGLTGTISGSAVANTASTGVITIPMMKRAGFPAPFSAGVEAAASTGGQLMPPIMGAGAFVMASITQIPYPTIVSVSVLPALLYFLTVAFFVRIEARRSNIVQAPDAETPSLAEVFRRGGPPFVIPIGLLIGMLVRGYTPTHAAGYAILACIAASWLTPNRMGLWQILSALELGARNMIMTAVLLCAVGLIVNVITTAGVGNTFSLMIVQWSGGSLLLAIVLVALASLILGMGLPVTAAYIVLATLSAPALSQLILQSQLIDIMVAGQLPDAAKPVLMLAAPESAAALNAAMSSAQAGEIIGALPFETKSLLISQVFAPQTRVLALLCAHMIVFWLSQDSNVTPPVCLAAFTAAAIAESPPMKTGVSAWKTAKGLYIVPVLFAFTPILSGDWVVMLTIFVFALFGVWALCAAIEGHWEQRLPLLPRLVVLLVGLALLWPLPTLAKLPALAAFALLFVWNTGLLRRG